MRNSFADLAFHPAPYKKNTKPGKTAIDRTSKPLYVEGSKAPGIGNGCTSVDMFTFEKVTNNMDKGPRVEEPSTIKTGAPFAV